MAAAGFFLTICVPVFIIIWIWDACENGVKHANEELSGVWGCGIVGFLLVALALVAFLFLIGFCIALGGL